MEKHRLSRQTLLRLPLYLHYLQSLSVSPAHISATNIAEGLGLNDVQVRKDLAAVCSGGKPKVGYVTEKLVADLQDFLRYGGGEGVVIAGMGHLGKALAHHSGFGEYGQRIVALFDADPAVIGTRFTGKEIQPVACLPDVCRRLGVRTGIIATPAAAAREVCELMAQGGVRAVWNFAPVHLVAPEGMLVQNENLAASLALLSRQAAGEDIHEERGRKGGAVTAPERERTHGGMAEAQGVQL